MRIRDALESDAAALADLTGRPRDVAVNLVHDRSVRVAVRGPKTEGSNGGSWGKQAPTSEDGQSGSESDGYGDVDDGDHSDVDDGDHSDVDDGDHSDVDDDDHSDVDDGDHSDDVVVGFLAFDAGSEVVHVTDFGGAEEAVQRLFEEPCRFAERERMDVDVVVPDDDEDRIRMVESAGFEPDGNGPRFDGRDTTRFRLGIEQ